MRISWKHGFADQSLAWSRSKNTIEYKKHKKHKALGVHSPPNYTMAELNDVFRKKKKNHPIFIYNGMTLTLKLLS